MLVKKIKQNQKTKKNSSKFAAQLIILLHQTPLNWFGPTKMQQCPAKIIYGRRTPYNFRWFFSLFVVSLLRPEHPHLWEWNKSIFVTLLMCIFVKVLDFKGPPLL